MLVEEYMFRGSQLPWGPSDPPEHQGKVGGIWEE